MLVALIMSRDCASSSEIGPRNSFDMRLMKNNIALLYPDAIFLCSQSNEDRKRFLQLLLGVTKQYWQYHPHKSLGHAQQDQPGNPRWLPVNCGSQIVKAKPCRVSSSYTNDCALGLLTYRKTRMCIAGSDEVI